MATAFITYEVRVADRDGNIRAHQFVDRNAAVRFAEFQQKNESEVISFNLVTRNLIENWRDAFLKK